MAASRDLVESPSLAPPYVYRDSEFYFMEVGNVGHIMRHWFGPHLAGVRPPVWQAYPEHYMVVDVETTGPRFPLDVIVEFGWCIVQNRQAVDCGGAVLNWYGHPFVDWNFVCDRMAKAAYHMANRGRTYHFTPERLQREGIAPAVAMGQIYDLILDGLLRGDMFVGHNAWSFDRKMIDANMYRFREGSKLPWHPNSIFDTGLTEKASQTNRLPWPEDNLDSWSRRVAGPPFKSMWSLDEHCIPKYRLKERYGQTAGPAHTGAGDCLMNHYLFETFRDIGEGRYCG